MQTHFYIDIAAIPLIIGIFLSLLMAPLLIWRHLGNPLGNRILAVIVLIIGFVCLDGLFFISRDTNYPLLLLRVSGIIATFYGPLLYLYIKAFTTLGFKLLPKHLFHLIPAALFLIGMFFFFQNEAEILERINRVRENQNPDNEAGGPGILLIFLSLFYFILSFRLVRKFRKHVVDSSSFLDKERSRWLLFMFGILLLPILIASFGFIMIRITGIYPIPGFGAGGMLLFIHLLYILKPDIFSGYPISIRIKEGENPVRYESSSLSPPQKEKHLAKLLGHMEHAKPYLKSELTLSELAHDLNINTRYLSQVINEKRSQNFMDFINSYRIDLAKELLEKKSHQHFTVLAIAQEVGFKSRSAFYEAFRKQTGTTPASYRKKAKI